MTHACTAPSSEHPPMPPPWARSRFLIGAPAPDSALSLSTSEAGLRVRVDDQISRRRGSCRRMPSLSDGGPARRRRRTSREAPPTRRGDPSARGAWAPHTAHRLRPAPPRGRGWRPKTGTRASFRVGGDLTGLRVLGARQSGTPEVLHQEPSSNQWRNRPCVLQAVGLRCSPCYCCHG